MINWDDLHYFSVLARTGSLSAAARELNVDHVTVGRRIESLENALQVRLVDRLPRSRPVTEDGRIVAEITKDIERIINSLHLYSSSFSRELDATVRVSVSPGLAVHWLTPIIPKLKIKHPKLKILVLSSTGFSALDKGECDLAIRMTRPNENDLMIRKIGDLKFGLYSSPEYLKRPSDEYEFIAYHRKLDHLPQQVWLHEFRRGRTIAFESSDVLAQHVAAQSGLGIAVLPTIIGEKDPKLSRIDCENQPPIRPIWLTAYPDMRRSVAVKTVMDFLANSAQDEPNLN